MSRSLERNTTDRPERQPIRNVPDLNLQALLREPIQERLDYVERRALRGRTPPSPPINWARQQNQDAKPSEPSEAESDQGSNISDQRGANLIVANEIKKVTKQTLVSFSIGKYHDEVLCDVMLMHARHLLLGRPWQFDRRVKHNSFANQYTFKHHEKNITLAPLLPKQVMKDQQRLKQSMEQMREKEEKSIERKASCDKNMSDEKEKESKRKLSEKEKNILINRFLCVSSSFQVKQSKEIDLYYILEKRRFVLNEKGKTDLCISITKAKQGMMSENFKTSLFYLDDEDTFDDNSLFGNHLSLYVIGCSSMFSKDLFASNDDIGSNTVTSRVVDRHMGQITLKKKGNDVTMLRSSSSSNSDPIELSKGPMTRAQAKHLQEAASVLFAQLWNENELHVKEEVRVNPSMNPCTFVQVELIPIGVPCNLLQAEL
ncbi:hypothetical protein J1N35_018323 [Gossypium stocksii]|uniref:Uncharacterized protein n=1 Tax=Gossypium stocksii TaxID=47602 RepID=A0A9D3VNU6_9ROSI|nr:hypothetical protein J1N35_018323 [Gossypium stocksii]